MTKLIIGVIAPPFVIPPEAYGGVERAVDSLCRGLAAQGHEVRLWAALSSTCPVPRSGVIEEDESEGWHGTPEELHHILAGYQWMEAQRVDVIHDMTFAGPLVGPNLTDKPVVTTNHLPFTPPSPGQSSPDLSLIYQTIAARVPVLAISRAQAAGAEGFTPHTIHHGVDVDNIPVGRGDGDAAGPYAAFCGRMAPEKGVREAILAAREAGLRLKIAARLAEEDERTYYENDVAPLIDGESIQFLGELAPMAVYDLLGGAVAMVNPVDWPEPFGLAMVESLATGTPVIARRGGAVAEIVEHGVTGAVCDTLDEVVAALRKHQSYDREACRAVVERYFSHERMAADHVDFYESVLQVTSTGVSN